MFLSVMFLCCLQKTIQKDNLHVLFCFVSFVHQKLKARDWKNIIPDSVTFNNCFKVRKLQDEHEEQVPVPHMFTFMSRSGLMLKIFENQTFEYIFVNTEYHNATTPSAMLSASQLAGMPDQARNLGVRDRKPRSMGIGPQAMDIFCLVKDSMSSKELSQDPLLVWPASLESRVQGALAMVNDRNCPTITCELDDSRKEELRLLKVALSRDFPTSMRRAITFYQTMIDSGVAEQTPAPLTFLSDAKAHRINWSDFQLSLREPGPRPHELQVVFHRGR